MGLSRSQQPLVAGGRPAVDDQAVVDAMYWQMSLDRKTTALGCCRATCGLQGWAHEGRVRSSARLSTLPLPPKASALPTSFLSQCKLRDLQSS